MRLELLEAIREAREWRWGRKPPVWLQPAWQPALELGQWLGSIPRSG